MMKRREKSQVIMGAISLLIYVAVAWVGSKLFEGIELWQGLALLLAARAFFGLIEGFSGVLSWRLFGKRQTVNDFLHLLRASEFPPRFYEHDDFTGYLSRVEDGEFPAPLKQAAAQFEQLLRIAESQGILAGMRMHAAAEAALEVHSPRARAPVFGQNAI